MSYQVSDACRYVGEDVIGPSFHNRIVARAVIVATAVAADGNREVLDLAVGDSEDEVFWTQFLRRLRDRGLHGAKLVISDAHSGLKAAISKTLVGASWQRCRVHLMRNLLATVPRGHGEMVAATVRTIFAQPDEAATRTQLRVVADTLRDRFATAADLLDEAEADLCAYATFFRAHWTKLWSTNPSSGSTGRSNAAATWSAFPDDRSVTRLVGAVLSDEHDEWQVGDRRYLSEASMALIDAGHQHDRGEEVTAPPSTDSPPPNPAGTLRATPTYTTPRDTI
jgi:putative transposase